MNIKTANSLYELRKKNGYSQEELANKLGISREAVSKWERAESSPSTDNLIALAKLYNISLDDLLLNDKDIDDEQPEIVEKVEIIATEENKKRRGHTSIYDGSIFLLATIAFLLLGFIWDFWSWGWLTFLLAICLSSLYNAIEDKRFSHFAYPVFIAMVYLFLGLAYPGIWHPTWILFLTIPVYYGFAAPLDRRIHHEDIYDDKDDED